MGARHESDNLAIIYRPDPIHGGVHETRLPTYLSAIAPVEVRGNVEVRRWVGTRCDIRKAGAREVDVPFAIFARSAGEPSAERWRGFWNEGGAHDRGVVTFKSVPVSGGRLQTMILPARAVQPTVAALIDHLDMDQDDIHVFTLSPLNRHPVEVTAAAVVPARSEVESAAP